MDLGTEEGLDVPLGWSKEYMTPITNVTLGLCPTARKAGL